MARYLSSGRCIVPFSLSLSTEYTVGRTYFYQYEAQIVTGNPEMSKQFSGYQMRCVVRLVMLRNRRVHMRLERIRFLQTNRILPVRRPMIILPFTYFEKLSNPQDSVLVKRMLSIPVSYLWTPSGWLKDLRVSRTDTFWSLNIKKGLMTMLNFNMRIRPSAINHQTNGIFKRTKYFEVKCSIVTLLLLHRERPHLHCIL